MGKTCRQEKSINLCGGTKAMTGFVLVDKCMEFLHRFRRNNDLTMKLKSRRGKEVGGPGGRKYRLPSRVSAVWQRQLGCAVTQRQVLLRSGMSLKRNKGHNINFD